MINRSYTQPNFLTSLENKKNEMQASIGGKTSKDIKTPTFKIQNASIGGVTSEEATQNSTQGRGATNLFVDEQEALQKMLSDGLSEEKAKEVITARRKKMLGEISQEESQALSKMIQDGVNSEKAVEIVRKKRYQDLPAYKKALKVPFDATVGSLGMVAEQVGNVGGFLGSESMQKTGEEIRDITTRTTGDSKAAKAGEIITGAGELFAAAPAKVAPTLKGRTIQGAIAGGIAGAGTEILGEGEDTTLGEVAKEGVKGAALWAAAVPVLEKAVIPGVVAGARGLKNAPQNIKNLPGKIAETPKNLQKGIEETADRLSTNINRMTKGQIQKFKQEIGVSPGKFLNDRGITDTGEDLVIKLSDNLKKSRTQADKGLEAIEGRFTSPAKKIATSQVNKETGEYIVKKQDPIRTMLEDNLDNAASKGKSEDSIRMLELLKKYDEGGITMSEVNEAKRFLNKNNKFSYFSDDTSSRKGFVTELDNTIREWQFKTAAEQGFDNLKEINKQTKAYYKLMEGISGWQEGTKGNLPMGLTDWLAFNADPSIFLTKQIAGSGMAKRGILKGLNKLSGRTTQSDIIKAKNIKNVNNTNISGNSYNLQGVNKGDVKLLPVGKRITPQTQEKAVIQESKKGLENTKIGNFNTITENSKNYTMFKNGIDEANTIEELTDIKNMILESNHPRLKEFSKIIDDKIDGISEMDSLGKMTKSEELLKEYGEDVIGKFKKVYSDELRTIKTKSGDKYTKIETLETKNAKELSDSIQEYINDNPWVGDKTVQDIYDELKDKLVNTNLKSIGTTKKLVPEKSSQIDKIDPKTGEGFTKDGKSLGIVDKKVSQLDINKKISDGYKKSANERFQNSEFTQTEINKGYEKLESLYEGKKIEFNGTKGEIIGKPYFGKIKVKIGDKIKEFDTSYLKETQNKPTKNDVIKYLRSTEYEGYNLIPKKSLDNKGGYINPVAMVEDISKALTKLTPKNTYNTARIIANKLGVEVKKVHTILKEYVSKYGDDLKSKLGDLADDIADRLGARAKFMDDTGKSLDDFKEVGTTESADIKIVEQYYKSRTGNADVSDIMKRFEKSSDVNKAKVIKKAKEFSPLNNYTDHQGRINGYLRTGEGLDSTKTKAKEVIEEIKKLPKYEGKVYRGVSKYDGLEDLRIGEEFSDKAILSSSQSKMVADRFADNVLFEIKSKTGRDLGDFGTMKSEQEVLFLPNTKFLIDDITTTKNKTIIKMSEK